jgi:hypothetical protein
MIWVRRSTAVVLGSNRHRSRRLEDGRGNLAHGSIHCHGIRMDGPETARSD